MTKGFVERVQRKVQLDKEQAWIFGVCAGVARYLRVDPALVRVAVLVVTLFAPKIVIGTYLVAWLVLDDRSLLKRHP